MSLKDSFSSLNTKVGGLLVVNPGVRLMITNPTHHSFSLSKVSAGLEYKPESEPGNHGVNETTVVYNFSIDGEIALDSWGATTVELNPGILKTSMGIGDMFLHGASGFLEDCARGSLSLELLVGDLDFTHLLGVEMGAIVTGLKKAILAVALQNQRIPIPIYLPDDVTSKCAGAVEALNWFTGQNEKKIENTELEALHALRKGEAALLEQEGDDQSLALKREVTEVEEEALLAAHDAQRASTALVDAIEEASEEQASLFQKAGNRSNESEEVTNLPFKDALQAFRIACAEEANVAETVFKQEEDKGSQMVEMVQKATGTMFELVNA